MMFDVYDNDDYSELISMKMMMMMILLLTLMSKAIKSSSFLCDCKIKCAPCDQGRTLSSTALCGPIVTLTFIFSVKATGQVVQHMYLYKEYIKITALSMVCLLLMLILTYIFA